MEWNRLNRAFSKKESEFKDIYILKTVFHMIGGRELIAFTERDDKADLQSIKNNIKIDFAPDGFNADGKNNFLIFFSDLVINKNEVSSVSFSTERSRVYI